ncbi:MAG: SRPBCC family protein [Saprospirales bacterium]|nr:SRPBCC family protein [Saprospirales bacterium]MBK8492457.1 SRPBCC family protein [Saprospirales bacterium]
MHQLKSIQRIPIDLKTAWEFFSSPRNLSVITPPEMGFEVQSELPEKMYPGLFIQYKVRPLFGIPVTWVTEITHVQEGEFFVDEQRVGPYRIWHHQHFFKEIPGGVEMTDIVDYQLPFGFLGDLVHPFLVGPRLKHIFDFRYRKLVELFGEMK